MAGTRDQGITAAATAAGVTAVDQQLLQSVHSKSRG
jgi:hypothetical protein